MDADQIKVKVSIEQVLDRLGLSAGLRPSAGGLSGPCPLPDHSGDRSNTSAFHIFTATNTFNCFTHCKGGDIFALVELVRGVSFLDAQKWILETFLWGTNTHHARPNHCQPGQPGTPEITTGASGEQFTAIYERFLDMLEDPGPGDYLTAVRGVPVEVLIKNGVKKLPAGIGATIKQSLLESFPKETLLKCGLFLPPKGGKPAFFMFTFCGFVYPYYQGGRVTYLQGVTLEAERQEGKPKNFNLAGSIVKPLLYLPKQFQEYKLDEEVIITEGALDALSMLSMGMNAVGIMDASITNSNPDRLQALEVLKPFKVVIIGDNDRAGMKAEKTLYKFMRINHFSVDQMDIAGIAKGLNIEAQVKDANDILKASGGVNYVK